MRRLLSGEGLGGPDCGEDDSSKLENAGCACFHTMVQELSG